MVGDDDDMISRCNKVLDLSKILNKSLEPFEEWNRILISLNKLLELELGLDILGKFFVAFGMGQMLQSKFF